MNFYSSKKYSMTNVGTQVKFSISLTLPGGLTMDDIRFTVEFLIYSNRIQKTDKTDMKRINANNYVAVCDTDVVGRGEIKMRVTAYLPDGEAERKEIETISTRVVIS